MAVIVIIIDERYRQIEDETNSSNNQRHSRVFDWFYVDELLYCLEKDAEAQTEKEDTVEEASQNFGPLVAEGHGSRGILSLQVYCCSQGYAKGDNVVQAVESVCYQDQGCILETDDKFC